MIQTGNIHVDIPFIVVCFALFFVLPMIIFIIYFILVSRRDQGRTRKFVEGIGIVVAEESSAVSSTSAWKTRPDDGVVHQVEVASYFISTGSRQTALLSRMQLHLVSNYGLCFELTAKRVKGLEKLFDLGEGELGIETIDEHFWTESPKLKAVVKVLMDKRVHKAFSELIDTIAIKNLYSVLVMGDRIQLMHKQKPSILTPLYQLALAIAHSLKAQQQ